MKPNSDFPSAGTPGPGDPKRSALDWPAYAGKTDLVLREVEIQIRRRRQLGVVAGVLGVLLAGAIFLAGRQFSPAGPLPRAAAILPPTRQVLADGSVVELKDGAEISVAFAETVRRVTLVRGTAHFQVAKNALRPFVVLAGGVQVQAVGTAFSVSLKPRELEVLVTEGRVSVAHAPAPATVAPRPAALVDAGKLARLDLAPEAAWAPEIRSLTPGELKAKLAWRIPQLELSGTSLAEVISIFNRHIHERLVLTDPALGRLELSGIIRADNTEALLQLLKSDFGIEAERRGENEVLLRSTPP